MKTPHRPATILCATCRKEVIVSARGRVPTYCSDSCRTRAGEIRRAIGPAPEVVERMVDPDTAEEWAMLLMDLGRRLDAGLVYDRDLPVLTPAMTLLVTAFNRRRLHASQAEREVPRNRDGEPIYGWPRRRPPIERDD